jgi:hypothetical protein
VNDIADWCTTNKYTKVVDLNLQQPAFRTPSSSTLSNIHIEEGMMVEMELSQFLSHNPDSSLKYSTGSSTRNDFTSHSSLTAVQHSDVKSFDIEADMAEALMPRDPNARPKTFRTAFEECVFVFTVVMCAASTTFLQGVTIINTATIGKDLHMSVAEVTWISAALGYEQGSPSIVSTVLTSLQSLQRIVRTFLRKDSRSLRP